MNKLLFDGFLKMAKTMLPPDAINSLVEELIKSAIEEKQKFILDAEKGETDVIFIVYEVNGETYGGLAITSAENQILRFENIRPVKELVQLLISKL